MWWDSYVLLREHESGMCSLSMNKAVCSFRCLMVWLRHALCIFLKTVFFQHTARKIMSFSYIYDLVVEVQQLRVSFSNQSWSRVILHFIIWQELSWYCTYLRFRQYSAIKFLQMCTENLQQNYLHKSGIIDMWFAE